MIKTKPLILILIITFFTSKTILGQTTDSLKNVMMDKIKSSKFFKENIYDFKNKELPKFELTLLNGKKINSKSLKGKPTVINFWFNNCQPCIEEIPLLNEIKSRHKNSVNFISITFLHKNEVELFLKTNEFNFTHIIDSKEYLKTFGFFGYPKTLILNKNLIITQIEKMIPKDIENEKKNKEEFVTRVSNKLTELQNVN